MLVPRYWAQAVGRESAAGAPPVRVHRFGWSSASQDDADVHARRRLEEALAALRAGGPTALASFTRTERKVAYAGSDGLPIREEIVEAPPGVDAVLTRNGYGAVCLNSETALFADVDAPLSRALGFGCGFALLALLVGARLAYGFRDAFGGVPWPVVALGGAVALGGLAGLVRAAVERWDLHRRDPVAFALARARAWCVERPAWRVAVYATAAGARLLALHAPHRADDPETLAFLRFVGSDPLYVRMCTLQRCFRARLTPKPWRIGFERFRPGGTWPVTDPAKLAARATWRVAYEHAARGHAACRLVETVGDGRVDPAVERVRRLHDDRSRAASGLELA